MVIVKCVTVMVFDDEEREISPPRQTVTYLCGCGNEARYLSPGQWAPTACGVCDILKNEGRGLRRPMEEETHVNR